MAEKKEVTLESLQAGLNDMVLKFNQFLAAFQDAEEQRALDAKRLDSLDLAVRQIGSTPHPAGAGAGGNVAVVIAQLQQEIEWLKERPTPALTAQDAKNQAAAALKRESQAHQGDTMYYHSDPKALKVTRVVRNTAEIEKALQEGYFPTLELAAKATVGAKAEGHVVVAKMEELRRAMFKVA